MAGRPYYPPFNNKSAATSRLAGDNVLPVLSSPIDGDPTADGTDNFGVTTDKGTGAIYWAVTTDGGTATKEQIVAGVGGNIVAGQAGRTVVTAAGAIVEATAITGLTTATNYELFYVHVDIHGNMSDSATVGLLTL